MLIFFKTKWKSLCLICRFYYLKFTKLVSIAKLLHNLISQKNYFILILLMEGPVPMQSHCPTETLMFSSEATFNIQRSTFTSKKHFFIERPTVFDSRPTQVFESSIVFARSIGKTRLCAFAFNCKATTDFGNFRFDWNSTTSTTTL